MTEPRIDVLIPVYNGAATLQSALASIQRQTVKDIRIIVVDDGSTDATPQLLTALACSDPRIDVVTRPNSGIVDALNVGLARSRAEFVARHDADDLADPDRFADQLAYLEENPTCVAVSSYARHIDAEGKLLPSIASPGSPDLADPTSTPAREPYLMHPFLMARRTVMQGIAGYRHVFLSEDSDLYWRLQEVGGLHNIPKIMGGYRVHSGSLTSSSYVNAKVGALTSQLSAISAARRRSGRTDLDFPAGRLAVYRAASTLEALIEVGGQGLDPKEQAYLRIAVPAKLVEMSNYRLFEFDIEDCRFARNVWRESREMLSRPRRKWLSGFYSKTSVRLARKRRWRAAMVLTPLPLLPKVAAQLLYQVVVPDAFQTKVRERRQRLPIDDD